MKVYVNDPGVSSGIKNVEIYLNSNDKNGTSKTEITDGTSLKTDSTGTYAEILIPNNFKGTVAAKVTDNVELKICDYYDSPVIPQEPEIEDIVLSCSGTNRALRLGGSKRTISVASDIKDKSVIWSYEFNGNKLSVEELSNDFEISEGKNTLSIKALLNYNNLGKVIKIIATLPNKQPSSIELEVMR